jgi:hypothetical protein
MDNTSLTLISAAGMILVAGAAVVFWRRVSGLQLKWFWVGAGLWTVAVALKVIGALLINGAVIGLMKEHLSYPLFVFCGGLFVGVESSFFEIGLTLAAVLVWRQLGRDAKRAIGIGVGAGAFEAAVLGIGTLVTAVLLMAELSGTAPIREEIERTVAFTPLFWLAPPIERLMAVLCHASSRALVLLGTTHRKPMMVVWGFVIFSLLDAVAGAAQISGKMGQISLWWIELAILPFALISIPILQWCYRRWADADATGVTRSLAEGDNLADVDNPSP